ncbi:MAG: hypothetical protein AUH29_17595 [Candidatus Rokubacteria bacterium 13_1_40CM_69_27]|nr:MAG: hypothetical protein AUH29_17595 [Candidatus Rokubacteria bacterium 13_1_40CM_69_27]
MRRIARKTEVDEVEQRRALVAEHLPSIEPGLAVLESGLRLGRTMIDLVATDAKQTLVLIALGGVADHKLLLSTLDAYVWCLQYPDNLRRLYPSAGIAEGRPPRIMVVAERVPDEFVAWLDELTLVHAECVEIGQLRSTASDVMPFPVTSAAAAPTRSEVAKAVALAHAEEATPAVDRVATNAGALLNDLVAAAVADSDEVAEEPAAETEASAEPAVAGQWETFFSNLGVREAEAPAAAAVSDAPAVNTVASNGHAAPAAAPGTNGNSNRHFFARAARADAKIAPAPGPVAAPAVGAAPKGTPKAAVKAVSGAPNAVSPAAPAATKPAAPVAEPDPNVIKHPVLESLRFPRNGVSRQWQEFLNQLAAKT